MAESPAKKTRLNARKKKNQGQVEGKLDYCPCSSSYPNIKDTFKSPEGEQIFRERHQSRGKITQGRVSSLRSRLEEYKYSPLSPNDNKSLSNENNYIQRHSSQQASIADKQSGNEKILFVQEVPDTREEVLSIQNLTQVSECVFNESPEIILNIKDSQGGDCLTDESGTKVLITPKRGEKSMKHNSTKGGEIRVLTQSTGDTVIKQVYKKTQNPTTIESTTTTDRSNMAEPKVITPLEDITLKDVYTMLANFQSSMQNVPTAISNVETAPHDLKTRMTALETNKTQLDQRVTKVETDTTTNEETIKEVSERMSNVELQVQRLERIVKKQDVHIQELTIQNSNLKTKVLNSNCCMTITGIKRGAGENCKDLVAKFFAWVMGIKHDMQITKAFRIGGEDSTTIMFYLARPTLKGAIFKNISKLKDLKNVDGQFFNIRETLTGEEHEKLQKARESIYENKTLSYNALLTGPTYFSDITKTTGKFKTYQELQAEYGKTVSWLEYEQLKAAIPKIWLGKNDNEISEKDDTDPCFDIDFICKTKKPSKKIYEYIVKLNTMKYIVPKWKKYCKKINDTTSLEDYLTYFKKLYKITDDTRLRDFQYRQLTHTIPTNVDLKK